MGKECFVRRFKIYKYALSFFFFVFLLHIFVSTASAVVYINSTSNGGDGKSWISAFRSIEAAIVESGTNEEFWIAGGTYAPTDSLTPKIGSAFYGGFRGNEDIRDQRSISEYLTVIDGQNFLKHIIVINDKDIILNGLVIKRGAAVGSGPSEEVGGGVLINRASAVIIDCVFENNTANSGGAVYAYESDLTVSGCQFTGNAAGLNSAGRGGAIWVYSGSPKISSSTFSNNSAGLMGGAIELNYTPNALISNSTFSQNSSMNQGGGGAVSLQWAERIQVDPVTFEKCTFIENTSELEGGGIYSNHIYIIVKQCTFIGNEAANGGAIMMDYDNSMINSVDQSLFLNNSATIIGGAIRSYGQSLKAENSIFAYNYAADSAGGIGFHSGTNSQYSTTINSCTFYSNKTDGWGGAIQNTEVAMLQLNNSILWGNEAGNSYWDGDAGKHRVSKDVSNNGSSSMTTRHTDMESLDWEHGSVEENHLGSFSINPLFVDPDGVDNIPGTRDDDFHLTINSPCIDRADGQNASLCDKDCYPRIDHTGIVNSGTGSPDYADVGALERIENQSTQPCSSCSVTLPVITPPSLPSSGDITLPPIMHLLLGAWYVN